MLTASAQKDLGRALSFRIVLAISLKHLFFLSTILFCRGVLGARKLWFIQFFSQNLEKSLFSNSLP